MFLTSEYESIQWFVVKYEGSSFVYISVDYTCCIINMVLRKLLSLHEEKGGLLKWDDIKVNEDNTRPCLQWRSS